MKKPISDQKLFRGMGASETYLDHLLGEHPPCCPNPVPAHPPMAFWSLQSQPVAPAHSPPNPDPDCVIQQQLLATCHLPRILLSCWDPRMHRTEQFPVLVGLMF